MILPIVADTIEGPQTHGTYIWVEFDNLQKIEDRLIDGPYIHHFVKNKAPKLLLVSVFFGTSDRNRTDD